MVCMMMITMSLFITLAVSACSSVARSPATTSHSDVGYIVWQGWHAETVFREELDEDMSFTAKSFLSARVIMFSYGKKTFFIAPPETVSEYLFGPFPGSAVIQLWDSVSHRQRLILPKYSHASLATEWQPISVSAYLERYSQGRIWKAAEWLRAAPIPSDCFMRRRANIAYPYLQSMGSRRAT